MQIFPRQNLRGEKQWRTMGEQGEARDVGFGCDQWGRQKPYGKSTANMGHGGHLETGFVGRPRALGCH